MTHCLNLYVYNISVQKTLEIRERKVGRDSEVREDRWTRLTHFENLKHDFLHKLFHRSITSQDTEGADLFLVPLFLNGAWTARHDARVGGVDWNVWASENLHAWKRLPHRHLIFSRINVDKVPYRMNPAIVVHIGHTMWSTEKKMKMAMVELVQRKQCVDELFAVRSLYATRTEMTKCLLPDFNVDAEMCWKGQIDKRDVLAFRNKLVSSIISC